MYNGQGHGPPPPQQWHATGQRPPPPPPPQGHYQPGPSAGIHQMQVSGPPPTFPQYPNQGPMIYNGPPQRMHEDNPMYARSPFDPSSVRSPGQEIGSNSPSASALAASPTVALPAHTTVFVGTISAGVTDEWITKLLSACGNFRSFKRVNASFGFADFADPESVLRSLAVLANKELPSMSIDSADKPEARKKLTVKADEKTRKYLDQYQQGRSKTNDDEIDESQASLAVEAIIAQMSESSNISAAAESTPSYSVPSHLKDLPPEDVPEEHRGSVLSEIDRFRQTTATRDEERRRREKVQEFERSRVSGSNGTRAMDLSAQSRSSAVAISSGRADSSQYDRQSYSRPVDFVPGQHDNSMPADERDTREEERRQQREREDRRRAEYEIERRFLDLERARLAHWKRELDKENVDHTKRKELGAAMRRVFESWDQAREKERDMFYFDRLRWRSARRAVREREEREDAEDRQAQHDEEERARIDAEQFLAQQAAHMAEFEREQRAAGVLMPTGDGGHAPLKLKRAAGASAQEGALASTNPMIAATGDVLGNAEDDDDDVAKRRKGRLAHIDVTDEETKKQRFRANLPSDVKEVFDMSPAWNKVDEKVIEARYKPLLDRAIVESLGESVPDMVDELVSEVRKQSSAQQLVDVLEPVLEDEATQLVQKLWIELLVDTLAV